ncbi:MAG: hypothetical protein QG670_160 [Thermoproteota archaeon]|nr:hypothetical protein [Thermoproteota archaeon]
MFRSRGRRRKRQKRIRGARNQRTPLSIGEFTNFPTMNHGLAVISHQNTVTRIQHAIIQALYSLNGHKDNYSVSVSGQSGAYEGELAFEVGVANGEFFDYLDEETLKELCDPLGSGGDYPFLDFLVIATYHYSRDGKKIPLIFDHHVLRFAFNGREVDISLFHIKGTRRIPLDEFLNIIIGKIVNEAKHSKLRAINLEKIWTL